MDQNMKKMIMLEHYSNPLNKGLLDDESYVKVNMNSETCIDNLDFMYKIEDNIIKDIKFDGEACAISTSSASIMTELLIGKTKEEAINIMNNFINMIEEKPYDEEVLKEYTVWKKKNEKSVVSDYPDLEISPPKEDVVEYNTDLYSN